MFNFKKKFKNVVLIEYPCDGIWSIALQVENANNDMAIYEKDNEVFINVFLPNDTRCKEGKLLMVHKDRISKTNFTLEEGINLIKNLGIKDEPIKPTPYQIKVARKNANLTQEESANLIYSTLNDWNDWERGYSIMPFTLFELFLFKTSQKIEKRLETITLKDYETK